MEMQPPLYGIALIPSMHWFFTVKIVTRIDKFGNFINNLMTKSHRIMLKYLNLHTLGARTETDF